MRLVPGGVTVLLNVNPNVLNSYWVRACYHVLLKIEIPVSVSHKCCIMYKISTKWLVIIKDMKILVFQRVIRVFQPSMFKI